MIYITVKQAPIYHQMSLEEYIFGDYVSAPIVNDNATNTRTYRVNTVNPKLLEKLNTEMLIAKLAAFNQVAEPLREKKRHQLYHTFYIPKKSGGLRRIDAPNPDLMNALRMLKTIFEQDFGALYHTSAFAYIQGRSTLAAVKKHQQNTSKWFAKLDLHDFFGSTTLEYVMHIFSMIYPFSEIIKDHRGEAELRKALDLAFLNGGLPQGTPISPLITNMIMIPVDHALSNTLRDFKDNNFVYTRYADDFMISSRHDFNIKEIETLVIDILKSFDAPFSINASKTRYGSSAGRNWNLGLMLNKDNQITVGHKKKHQFQCMLTNYVNDKRKGVEWDKEDLMVLKGLHDYYHMVEAETIDAIIDYLNKKFNVNVMLMIKAALR